MWYDIVIMVKKSQKKATTKYENKVYSKVCIRIREDRDEITRDEITAAASAAGESLNEYILNAVKLRMQGGPAGNIEDLPF